MGDISFQNNVSDPLLAGKELPRTPSGIILRLPFNSRHEVDMPIISMFYGIVVMMYYFDDRRHHQPHIHVECGDEEAVVSIPDGTVIEGSIRSG